MFTHNNYINRLEAKDFVFSDFPQKKSMKDYEIVYSKIKNICSKHKEILSVYTFGEIKAPGISDIDLIFVLRRGAKLPGFLKKLTLDKDSKYVLLHPFFIVPADFMENISYIHPNSDYKLIYGQKIKVKELSKQDVLKVYQYLVSDVILRHFPSDYLNVLLSGKINVRLALVRLNALHHSFSLFKSVSGKSKKEWKSISDDIYALRKDWFNVTNEIAKRKILHLLKTALYVSLDFVEEHRKFMEARIKNLNGREIVFKGIQNRISFARNWNPQDALSQMINHYSRHKNFYSVLPKVFIYHLHAYASGKGPLSSYIYKRLSSRLDIQVNHVLMKRVHLSNYQVEYAMNLKHSHFPCFFPLGFKSTKGLKNKMIYVYVKITDHSLFKKGMHFIRSRLRFIPV